MPYSEQRGPRAQFVLRESLWGLQRGEENRYPVRKAKRAIANSVSASYRTLHMGWREGCGWQRDGMLPPAYVARLSPIPARLNSEFEPNATRRTVTLRADCRCLCSSNAEGERVGGWHYVGFTSAMLGSATCTFALSRKAKAKANGQRRQRAA